MSEENAKLLKSVGLKVTEPRLTILALMQQHREDMQHFSAEDIYKILLDLFICCAHNLNIKYFF